MVKKITNNDISEALKQPFAVLDFSATWCGPCRMLAPVLEEIAEESGDDIAFYNIDSDENDILARKFGIQSIPCLIILKNGEITDTSVGFLPKQQLLSWIDANRK